MRRWHRLLELPLAVGVFGMMAFTVIDVAGRVFFGVPLRGGNELIQVALAVSIAAGLPFVSLAGAHIAFSVLLDRLPGPHRKIARRVIEVACLLISGLVAYALLQRAQFLMETGEYTQVLHIRQWQLAVLLAVFWIAAALAHLRNSVARREDEISEGRELV